MDRAAHVSQMSTVVLIFVIGDVYTMWHAFVSHSVPIFTAVAWLQCIGLVVLYPSKSRFAGTYLFYSTAPIFPTYLGLKLAGVTPPVRVPAVYIIMSIMYIFVMVWLWNLKRSYDRFIASNRKESAA